MRRIRILLAGMPRMLLDMITDIVGLHAEMMVAGEVQDTTEIRAAVRKTRADIVILNEPAIGSPQDHQELLYSRPRLGVLSITSDGRQFFLHKLRPVRTALGEVSPDSLEPLKKHTTTGGDSPTLDGSGRFDRRVGSTSGH